jgi:hypothetical protein
MKLGRVVPPEPTRPVNTVIMATVDSFDIEGRSSRFA